MTLFNGSARLRLLGFILPLALVVVFATALAFAALDASRSHREAVLRTLGDHANFAAFILSNVAGQELERRVTYAFFPIYRYDPDSAAPLPPASALAQDRVESGRCAAAGDSTPSYGRLDLRTGELELAGAPLPVATQQWIADTLRAESRTVWNHEWAFAHIFGKGQRPRLIVYRVLADSMGHSLAVYMKTTCLDLPPRRSIFEYAMQLTPLLPPFLTGGAANDSLVSVKVMDPFGEVLWATPTEYASSVAGEWKGGPRFGGLRVELRVRPEIAERLVIGGVPPSRLPAAVLLLVLTVLSTAFAVFQLRQQQQLVRLRERFISNVSHELRTPLQQILLFTELQRMDRLRSEAEREHSNEVVERETRRLIQLVENVLQFSKAARGEDALMLQPLELSSIVQETVQTFQPLARVHDATIVIEADGSKPVQGDAEAMRRILINLLDNAVKYGPRGQRVTVRLHSSQGTTSLSIEDEGPGIPPAERERVFEPFQRLEREEKAAIAGSGVGLALVRDLVHRMHGRVIIEDTNGRGSRFVVQLPESGTHA